MAQETVPQGQRGARRAARPVIDCDVHNELQSFVGDLEPRLAREWRHYLTNRGFSGLQFTPYALWQGVDRRDVVLEEGRASARLDTLQSMHLDAWDIEYAVLTGPASAIGLCYLPQREFATALAAAYNEWVVDTWLGDKDGRIRGSIIVAAQDPRGAAREIDRWGDHPEVVQVILPTRSPGGAQWGDEKYDPIWEAAQRRDIAVGLHLNPFAGDVLPPTSAGWPRSYMELAVTYPQAAQAELVSIVCRGVFEKYPRLRVAFIENGFAWVPSLLWRLDAKWKELRAEVPWLKRRPSEYVREHVRFTTQPIDGPEDAKAFSQLLDMVSSEDVLMFSTDFPHWDFDSPTHFLPAGVDVHVRQRILSETAREFYRLPPASAAA